MPDWTNTRLRVTVDGEEVTPIESFTPTFSLNTEVIHSLEKTHVGYVGNPDNFTFSISVRAVGNGAALLTNLALTGTEFEIEMLPVNADDTGSEWEFGSVLLGGCLITSANPSNATINGAPAATFNGIARRVNVDDDELPKVFG